MLINKDLIESFVFIDFYMNLCLRLPGIKGGGIHLLNLFDYLNSLAIQIYSFSPILPPCHIVHFLPKRGYNEHDYSYKQKF